MSATNLHQRLKLQKKEVKFIATHLSSMFMLQVYNVNQNKDGQNNTKLKINLITMSTYKYNSP